MEISIKNMSLVLEKTMVIASHNPEDIAILCDRVYEMEHGVLAECRSKSDQHLNRYEPQAQMS